MDQHIVIKRLNFLSWSQHNRRGSIPGQLSVRVAGIVRARYHQEKLNERVGFLVNTMGGRRHSMIPCRPKAKEKVWVSSPVVNLI